MIVAGQREGRRTYQHEHLHRPRLRCRSRFLRAAAQPAASTLGARLAAASRQAQGLPSTVDDPAVLDELRGLCTAPRPTKRTAAKIRKYPAP
ncbi:hypothetical protein ABH922_001718 [Rhodococcus sp. 27YEA15]